MYIPGILGIYEFSWKLYHKLNVKYFNQTIHWFYTIISTGNRI